METKMNKQKYILAIGILISVISAIAIVAKTNTNVKVDEYSVQLLEIKTQISQIQTDIDWIKKETR